MTKCTIEKFEFPGLKRRQIITQFSGGAITSDAGGILLRQIDRHQGLTKSISKVLHDPRRQKSCDHSLLSLIRQRIYGLALGYEDLNDHQTLRNDPAFQTTLDQDSELASSSTLCRLENRANRQTAWDIHQIIVENFIASKTSVPSELILDFDATDDRVHGQQEGRFFHGYYDHYCFLPLYVFCEDQLLVSYLRPSKIDGAKHSWAILSLLVKLFRKEWPGVQIIIRADSGFCRHRMLKWCERHNVDYIIGIAKNKRLQERAAFLMKKAQGNFERTNEKQRLFEWIRYGAKSWGSERRVIAKAEHGEKGSNPRFVISSLTGEAQKLYDDLYCARGDMENRIKEQQLGLFADRTSCHAWYANQFRLLLSSLAYILIEGMRRLALYGTEFARAQSSTIRLKLFKIGAVITMNTRCIRFLMSSNYPYQLIFNKVARRLCMI
jgi:hypothetical protein